MSRYPFEGNADDAEGVNNPSATNNLTYVTGEVGSGVTFGTGGYIDIPDSASLDNQTFTLDAWARPDGIGPNNDTFGSILIGKQMAIANGGSSKASANLYWANDQHFRFLFGSVNTSVDYIVSTDTFAPGRFYHVAATYDGATFKLYVDGKLEGTKISTRTINYDHTIPWTIGSAQAEFRANGFPRTWNGVIDEVEFYDRA